MTNLTASALTAFLALSLAGAVGHETPTAAPTGSVEGTVTVRLPPPRRSARRYAGAAPAREIQAIPVIVWVKGRVPGATAPASAAMPSMSQKDTMFAPAALVVRTGATVRFPNQDAFFHNVFSYSGPARFDLGRYPLGESKDVTFDDPGVVKVYCEVHEFMRAAIVVTENPFHAVVDADGRFRIEGLPAGTYTLVFWHADLDQVEQVVTVADGGVARVQVELR